MTEKDNPQSTGQSSTVDLARLLFFLFVIVAVGVIFFLTPQLFPSALISLILYFVFRPIVDAVERRGISRSYGILAIFAVCGLLAGLSVSWVVPRISQEVASFQEGNTRFGMGFTAKLEAHEKRVLGHLPVFRDAALTKKGVTWLEQSMGTIWSTITNFASQLFMALFLVPFITFVLLKDGRELQRWLLKLVPNRHFETAYSVMFRIMDGMGGFVSARIIEAALVTTLVAIGCLAAGVPYALLLGVFAGATNPIPYLGPLLGAIPGVLIAVLDPSVPNQLLFVVLIYAIANLIDMLVIFPVVVAKIVDLHPVIVVISVILGSQLFGIVGMIVAVPLTSILKIFIQEIYSRIYGESGSSISNG